MATSRPFRPGPPCECRVALGLVDYIRHIGIDLHKVIAAHRLDIPYSQVTPEQRQAGKLETLRSAYRG